MIPLHIRAPGVTRDTQASGAERGEQPDAHEQRRDELIEDVVRSSESTFRKRIILKY
jgi:hypothetical protein